MPDGQNVLHTPIDTPDKEAERQPLRSPADASGADEACGVCSLHDKIAEQRRVSRRLGENQDYRLRAAINQLPQGIALFDSDQRLIVCNDSFRDLYSLPSELAEPSSLFWDIIEHGATRGLLPRAAGGVTREQLLDLINGRQGWQGDIEMRDGRWIRTTHEPLRDGGWISMQEDISADRKREETEIARLRESEAQAMRFNAALDNMSHGLSLFDADRRLVVCNKTYAKLYHLPPELTRPGTHFFDIYRHRHSLGLTDKDLDLDTGYAQISRLIDSGASSHSSAVMTSGQVIKLNHQPLADGGWLSTHEDITEQHRNAEIIRYLARHDSLTGLANRTTFLEAMSGVEAQVEDGDILAVICLDLDRFKEVNDSLGHAVGDSVLTGVSGRILSVLDGRGLTARLGGDEFAALVGPLDTPSQAIEIAEELMKALEEPLTVGNARITSGASCGIALAPQHGHDAQTLLRCADLALYRAKTETPGGFKVFEARMDVAQRRRLAIENGLRNAIAANTLSLMYQPLIALDSGRVSCCEALMRWQSPELGMVPPDEFIPIAEETGLIREIGVWALTTACTEATNWPCHIRVAVNVSPIQFRGDDLVDQVRRALAVSGLEPSRLELEITESLFLADDAHNLEILHRLRDLGVRFALDDFGTGYSSLAYMLRFPFDKVKIDREIVSTIADKPETVAMITAIVELCRGFDMLTVAEGIETEKQLAEVKAHGCDEVQGYIFSPPLPQSAIGELLKRRHLPDAEAPVVFSAAKRA